MKFKKTILVVIALFGVIILIGAVSAGLFDFGSDNNVIDDSNTNFSEEEEITDNDTLKKSSLKFEYADPAVSSEYGYFYEDGNFAGDAYWVTWSFQAKLKFDVEKIFEKEYGSNPEYSLDDFKQDLKYMVKHDYIDFDLLTDEGSLYINDTAITSSLNDDCSELVVKCDYADEEYTDGRVAEEITSKIKNSDAVDIDVSMSKYSDHKYKTGDEHINIDLTDIPVKVSKMN